MLTVGAVLRAAKQQLTESASGSLDAELLLAHVLKQPRSYVLAYEECPLTADQVAHYQSFIQQRTLKIPLAYLLGEKEFWSLRFIITPEVLVPRPETELLVECVLADHEHDDSLSVIDLGTGSGAIAIALSYEKPRWNICASDWSLPALALAKKNANRLVPTAALSFVHSHWLLNFSSTPPVDVIVSNPPYLGAEDPHLIGCEISHEPRLALIAEDQGLADYQIITHQAISFLKPGGRIYFEHGADQAAAVAQILTQAGFASVRHYRDLAGLSRVTSAVR